MKLEERARNVMVVTTLECDVFYRDDTRLGTFIFGACPRRGDHIYISVHGEDQEYWVLRVTHLAANSRPVLRKKHEPMTHLVVSDKFSDFGELVMLSEIHGATTGSDKWSVNPEQSTL